MSYLVQEIAAEVIRSTSRDKPADAALREVLKQTRDLAPFDATEVAKTVFLYYRWHGWLRDERGGVDAKMRVALRLAERFRANPASIPIAELRAKAVPAWTAEQMEVSDDWLRSLQREPKLWLRAKRGQAAGAGGKIADRGRRASRPCRRRLVYEGDTDLFKTPEFHAGEFEIQDIASQAVGWLCDPKPGETWWDACAGEGGKLLHLSDLMQNKGLIWASDRAAWRLQKLKRRTARAKVFNYRAALWDGGAKLPTKTKFDGVLVDAPCSGVGTWQRNPHARWTTTVGGRAGVGGSAEAIADARGREREAGRQIDLLGLHVDAGGNGRGGRQAFSEAQPEFEPMRVAVEFFRAKKSAAP